MKRVERKQKAFDKKLEQMKKDVRAANYKLRVKEEHQHQYTVEHIEEDKYRKTCNCGISFEYEEM